MSNIKLTLSTNPAKHAPSIEVEARWLEEEGELWYPLGRNRPVKQPLAAGCISSGEGSWSPAPVRHRLIAHPSGHCPVTLAGE
jgi:hypothetical protein